MDKIDLETKFSLFDDHWNPRVVAELNGQQVKLAKLLGEFDWHHHQNEDELFYVVRGRLTMRYRDREVLLQPGEMCVVPRGVEHQPFAEEETWVVLFEPATTLNTGNTRSDKTRDSLERI